MGYIATSVVGALTNPVYLLVIKDLGRPSASWQETPIPRLTLVLLRGLEPGAKGHGTQSRVITEVSLRMERSDPKLEGGTDPLSSLAPA